MGAPRKYGIHVTAEQKSALDGYTTLNIKDLNLSGVPAYADDTAAGVGGLVSGDVFQTSGTGGGGGGGGGGALGQAGLLMIKQ